MNWHETEKRIRATISRMGIEWNQDDVVQEILLKLVENPTGDVDQFIKDSKRSEFRDYWLERYLVREFDKNPADAESNEAQSSYFDFKCAGSGAINRHAYDKDDGDIGDEELQDKLVNEFDQFLSFLRIGKETATWIKETLDESERWSA